MVWFRITPESPRPIWLWHRLLMKAAKTWRWISVPSGEKLQVRYLSEGRFNYVFEIRGEAWLLKILREQYYSPDSAIETQLTKDNCDYMNSLADVGLGTRCQHIGGGAFRVEHAGAILAKGQVNAEEIKALFQRIFDWSVINEIVILDYNERNWCIKDGIIRLVDFDINYTCALSDIANNDIVRQRIDPGEFTDHQSALRAFLAKEKVLLWENLERS